MSLAFRPPGRATDLDHISGEIAARAPHPGLERALEDIYPRDKDGNPLPPIGHDRKAQVTRRKGDARHVADCLALGGFRP